MKKILASTTRFLRMARAAIFAFLTSAMTWLLAFAFCSAGLISSGVYLMFGRPLALICAGVFSMLFAVIIFRGMKHG